MYRHAPSLDPMVERGGSIYLQRSLHCAVFTSGDHFVQWRHLELLYRAGKLTPRTQETAGEAG